MSFNTPILFLIFNRPECTRQVFNAIAEIKPAQLFLAADGPRDYKTNENILCEETREIVLKGITWPCEVKTLFRDTNLGCGLAVSEAITWFFDQVEQGIILEDDCLPDNSFFNYCESLLEKYKHNVRIGMISGDNFRLGELPMNESYGFTKYPHIWGWATWKRAWDLYDYEMKSWEADNSNGLLKKVFNDQKEVNYWAKTFDAHRDGQWDTWDYQWYYTCWKEGILSIEPAVNLIKNIGFGVDATHTNCSASNFKYGNQKSENLVITIHPKDIQYDQHADYITFLNRYYNPLISQKTIRPQTKLSFNALRKIKNKIFPNRSFKIQYRLIKTFNETRKSINYFQKLLGFRNLPKNEDLKIYVHLGCGDINWPKFINVDVRHANHIHYVSKVDKLKFLKKNSVDLIYVSHCLEHISHLKVLDVLNEWNRVLKKGGLLRISVPDFDHILDMYKYNCNDMNSIIQPLMGGQDYDYNFHFVMFNEKYLTELLRSSNFIDIKKWRHGQDEFSNMPDWSGREIYFNDKWFPISLNIEAIKS